MSDDLKRKKPEDLKKININQAWEVKYWAEKFKVTKEELIDAALEVGPIVNDVRDYLKIKGKINPN